MVDKHQELPGGSTPRNTPLRMTPLPSRGQHQTKPSHGSCLLEDVLAEKKMALMRSPEVIEWLQEFQQQVQEKELSPFSDTDVSTSEDACVSASAAINTPNNNSQTFLYPPVGGTVSDHIVGPSTTSHRLYTQANNVMYSTSEVPQSSYGSCMTQPGDQRVNTRGSSILTSQDFPTTHVATSGQTSTYTAGTHSDSNYQMTDPSRAHLVTQWLNANVHRIHVPKGGLSRDTQDTVLSHEMTSLENNADVTSQMYHDPL